MILEGAFYKLPELLVGHSFPRWQYEATLTSHLAMAVLLEFNARNIPMPQRRIHIERPYPWAKAGPAHRADLYVDLEGIFTYGLDLPYYGVKASTWIETKFHAGIGRKSSSETKTENAARLTQDLLRLCLLVKEEPSSIRDNSRYLLVVFNRPPRAYLAFGRRSRSTSARTWLQELLSPGNHQCEIPLKGETDAFIKAMGADLTILTDSLGLSLETVTYAFEPIAQPSELLYWGYLIRITKFTIRLGSDELVYDDKVTSVWSEEQESAQQRLVERVFGLEGGSG